MLRYSTDRTKPGLVALYDIWPRNLRGGEEGGKGGGRAARGRGGGVGVARIWAQILELNISGTVSRRRSVTIYFTQNFTGYTMVSVSRTYDDV